MAKRSEKRVEELQLSYGNGFVEPIKSEYINQAKEKSARYILFVNHNNRNGYCEKCGHDVTFDRTRHNAKVVCPNCTNKMIAQHTWRKPSCEWHVDWYVVGQALDEETMMLRYLAVFQNADYTKSVIESAREVYDFRHGWSYRFSYHCKAFYGTEVYLKTEWFVDDSYCFTEFQMNYVRRKMCCIGATPLNNIKAEVKKLSAMKYFGEVDKYFKVYVYPRDNIAKLMRYPLYEKLEKVGLGDIAMKDYQTYWNPMKYKRSEKSLVKMLGLNRLQYKTFLRHKTMESLEFLRQNKDMSMLIADYVLDNHKVSEWKLLNGDDIINNAFKSLKYIIKQGINGWEYRHYIRTLLKLNYELDDQYRYPKDFRKADTRVTNEYNDMLDKKLAEEKGEQSLLIKKISEGLRNMKDLQEFMAGSNGLFVYVPDSVLDLLNEGRRLHNCISSYVDRVAEGKTLVFFVRKLNAPDEPFVAFEYCQGEVVQCMYDNNVKVEDNNIISFVDAFANGLRKNKVLMAA